MVLTIIISPSWSSLLQPHIFGGLLHRDDCYNTLMEIGRANGLQFAAAHEEVKTEVRLSELADTEEDLVMETLSSSMAIS